MARYRKIDPRIWNDQKFRALSRNGKFVFLYLLTHPHLTSLGAMRASIAGLASELGWRDREFRRAFLECATVGLVAIDELAACVVVTNFLKYNPPENPNVVKSWASVVDLIPECRLKAMLFERVRQTLREGLAEALPKPFGNGMPNPEPEPEPFPPVVPQGGRRRRKPSDLSPEHLSQFERFYAEYPRKQKRAAAEKAWAALDATEELTERIVAAVRDQQMWPSWRKDGGRYIPHPSSWLNGRRWEDQPERGAHGNGSHSGFVG